MSDYFNVLTGLNKEELLSLKLYPVYVGDLFDYLDKSHIGCHINNVYVNNVMNANANCLKAPSPAALQKLINICYEFSTQNNLPTFSSDKKDDNDIIRQMKILYTKSNRLLELFCCCSTVVKLVLFCS